MGMRRCFLHVGTHKTATTSVQQLLSSHPHELAACGWLYPQAGRPAEASAGHHNLAWEISGDRRFRAEYGDAGDLIREIADCDRNIIISSEDFECSAHHTERFENFIAAIQRLGIRVSPIVFLRNQVDYAVSLYFTLIEFGFGVPFSEFCDEIVDTGALRWREWIYPFRYDDFIAKLAHLKDVEVVVRSYDHPDMGSPVLDFLSTIGLSDMLPPLRELPQENQRQTLSSTVRHYLASRAGVPLTDADFAPVAAVLPAHPTMSMAGQVRFAKAFAKSNQLLCEKYRFPPFARMQQGLSTGAGPTLDDIFDPNFYQISNTKSVAASNSVAKS